jgi:hypothetical protein
MAFGLIPQYNPTPPPLTPEEEAALAAEQAQVIDSFGAPSPVVDPAAAAPVGEVQTVAPEQSYQAAPPPEQVAAPPPADTSYQGMGYEATDPGMGYEGDPATVAAQAPAPEPTYVPAPTGAVETQNPNYVAPPPAEQNVPPAPRVTDTREPLPSESGMYGGMGGGLDLGGVGRTRQTVTTPAADYAIANPQDTFVPNTGNASGPGNFVQPTDADRRAIADRRAAGITEAGTPVTPTDLLGRLDEDYGAFLQGNPEVENFILGLAGTGPVGMTRSVTGGFGKGAALNALDNVQSALRAADDAIAMRETRPTTPKGQVMDEALDVASDTDIILPSGETYRPAPPREPMPLPPQTMTGNRVIPNRVTYPNPRTMTGNAVLPAEPTYRPAPVSEPMPLPPQTMTGNAVMPDRVTYPNPRTVTGNTVVPSTKRVAGETFV